MVLPMSIYLHVAQLVKNPSAVRETWVWSLGQEDPLEKGTATHSSILAWRIPWTIWGCKEPDATEWLSLSKFCRFSCITLPASLVGAHFSALNFRMWGFFGAQESQVLKYYSWYYNFLVADDLLDAWFCGGIWWVAPYPTLARNAPHSRLRLPLFHVLHNNHLSIL